MRWLWTVCLVLTLLGPLAVQAAERILSFHGDIRVQSDAALVVTETIRVFAEGTHIKRGIYRDFPTVYTARNGVRHRTGFTVLDLTRDGVAEPYRIEPIDNGKRVYIGRREVFVQPGEHVYVISYRATRQLGFFDTHDELYWNVTGNAWAFPIAKASASVSLPAGVEASSVGVEGYTGRYGAGGSDYTARVEDVVPHFATTRTLQPGEGLTIVVTWPSGFVARPNTEQRLVWFIKDNTALVVACAGLLALVLYYGLVWLRAGKDPDAGVIIPRYQPPPTFSPASMRFIREMRYDHKTFSAAIINLAVKGHLRIIESDGTYLLESVPGADAKLSPGEASLIKKLFRDKRSMSLRQANHKRISKAIKAHKNSLKADYEKIFFVTNRAYIIPGVIISALTLAGYLLLGTEVSRGIDAIFLSIFAVVWMSGVWQLLARAGRAWRGARSVRNTVIAIGLMLFALPFLCFGVFAVLSLGDMASTRLFVLLSLLAAVNWAFYHWMKSPTRAGRKLLDVIEGFRSYLDVAEKDELELKHPPQKTPALFEKYLPYALALDVEHSWGERFASTIAASSTEQASYTPSWYRGNGWNSHRPGSFTSSLGAGLSASVAAASTAPGSSSGSGGGGFSGGGGGGGGGGGW